MGSSCSEIFPFLISNAAVLAVLHYSPIYFPRWSIIPLLLLHAYGLLSPILPYTSSSIMSEESAFLHCTDPCACMPESHPHAGHEHYRTSESRKSVALHLLALSLVKWLS